MKKNIFLIILINLLIPYYSYSQRIGDLKGIYYQAVAYDEFSKEIVGKDIQLKPLYNKEIGVRFTITKGLNGPILYQETHQTITDKNGLFTLIIGNGNLTGEGIYNKLLDIPWIDADQFLKVEISTKNDGNYRLVSNQQFMAVPYSFYTDDIADNAITTEKILDSTISNQDIKTDAVDSRVIMNETIISEDIKDGGVTTSDILDATIQNDDIADGTIDLKTKVTNVLQVKNGGTGISSIPENTVLAGGKSNVITPKILASKDSSIVITQTNDSILFKVGFKPTEVTSDPAGTFNVNVLNPGETYVSNAINAFQVNFGDIVVASIDKDLQGCMLTAYVSQPNVIRIAIFNGTGVPKNFGMVNVRVFIIR